MSAFILFPYIEPKYLIFLERLSVLRKVIRYSKEQRINLPIIYFSR